MTAHELHDTFLGRLRGHALEAPDRTALVDAGVEITYAQLIAKIEARASWLVGAGVGHGTRVALVAENSADFLVAAFAVWRAQGVLVTIYPSSGAEDIGYCLERSDPALVLTDRATHDTVRAAAVEHLPLARIDEPARALSVLTGRTPNPADLGDRLAAVFFTSGTTSRPKAIMESADGLLAGARVYSEVWHLDERTRTAVALPMAWAYGLNTTAMATLYAGGCVISLRRAKPELMFEAIAQQRATFLPGVTTMFVKMVQALEAADEGVEFSSLRFCLSAGEPRNEAAFDRWAELTGCPVHDNFCATECYPVITYDPVVDPVPVRGSAGRVVAESDMRVVDPAGEDVPPGAVGEALWRAPNMMLGYWRDEEQTALAFTPDGWYRSNDLVRIDANGYVFVTGRLSDMIIRGGSNVSPAEVERVLCDHPNIRSAAVVGLPDPLYGQQVAAAIVVSDINAYDERELSAFAAGRLATYKVPSLYRIVQDLPLNSTTGKVDRRAVVAAFTDSVSAS